MPEYSAHDALKDDIEDAVWGVKNGIDSTEKAVEQILTAVDQYVDRLKGVE